MSGGSHDYLYANAPDAMALWADKVQRMHADMAALGHEGSLAAARTLMVAEMLRLLERECGRLADVWHAVEWYRSGDSGAESVAQAVKGWKP